MYLKLLRGGGQAVASTRREKVVVTTWRLWWNNARVVSQSLKAHDRISDVYLQGGTLSLATSGKWV
jgi:hypothetical protein